MAKITKAPNEGEDASGTPPTKTPKKTFVVAPKCTCTNPYTGDVFMQGIPRDTPKDKKHSWYKSQIEAGYLKEVKM